MIGALLVGFVTGAVARILIPFDTLRGLRGPKSWLFSLGLGVAGAFLGWLIFAKWIGWGDSNILDWGGIFGSIIGALILLIIFNWLVRFHVIGRPGR